MDREQLIERLKEFAYTYVEADANMLDFEEHKTKWHILNATNCSEIPEGLMNIAIDMVCANFLKTKKGFGQLTEIDFENVANSIRIGDTNIQFANEASPEQKFDIAIEYMLNGHEQDFLAYRKMVW